MAWFGGGSVGDPKRDPNVKIGNPDRTGSIDGFDAGGATGAGRRNVNNAPIVGQAITRAEYAKRQKDLLNPPSALENASIATGGARSAAERQRKRAAAGSTIASPASMAPAAGARFAPKTLIGY